MSDGAAEPRIGDRIAQRPELHPGKLRELSAREIGVRFAAGAATSIVAGAVTLAFGARTGGIMLAFPAILAASLTLIEEQEDSADAREDARGAVMGALALGVFAAVAALAFTHVPAGLALAIAGVAWLAAAIGGYLLAWFR